MIKKYLLMTVPPLTLLALVACVGGIQPVDNKKLLNGLEGPKVLTVEETLAESAKKSEAEGSFRQASMYYAQLVEKKPDDKDLVFSLAEAYRRGGEPDKAIPLYDKLIALDPKNIAAKESKGLALIAKGDFEGPTALFDAVMKEDPKRWKTLNALGILFATRNLQPEAQQYFNEALKNHPDSASIYNNLGLSQALDRKFDQATTSLLKGSALANSTTGERKRIDLNLALVYAAAGKLDDAKALAEMYLDGAALNNNLGLYAHLAKDDQMARAYLNMALTESKVYYAKAWDNLQDITANGNDGGASKGKGKPRVTKSKTAGKTALPADFFGDATTPTVVTSPAVVPPAAPVAAPVATPAPVAAPVPAAPQPATLPPSE